MATIALAYVTVDGVIKPIEGPVRRCDMSRGHGEHEGHEEHEAGLVVLKMRRPIVPVVANLPDSCSQRQLSRPYRKTRGPQLLPCTYEPHRTCRTRAPHPSHPRTAPHLSHPARVAPIAPGTRRT